jgi:hypothetical protein
MKITESVSKRIKYRVHVKRRIKWRIIFRIQNLRKEWNFKCKYMIKVKEYNLQKVLIGKWELQTVQVEEYNVQKCK